MKASKRFPIWFMVNDVKDQRDWATKAEARRVLHSAHRQKCTEENKNDNI